MNLDLISFLLIPGDAAQTVEHFLGDLENLIRRIGDHFEAHVMQ